MRGSADESQIRARLLSLETGFPAETYAKTRYSSLEPIRRPGARNWDDEIPYLEAMERESGGICRHDAWLAGVLELWPGNGDRIHRINRLGALAASKPPCEGQCRFREDPPGRLNQLVNALNHDDVIRLASLDEIQEGPALERIPGPGGEFYWPLGDLAGDALAHQLMISALNVVNKEHEELDATLAEATCLVQAIAHASDRAGLADLEVKEQEWNPRDIQCPPPEFTRRAMAALVFPVDEPDHCPPFLIDTLQGRGHDGKPLKEFLDWAKLPGTTHPFVRSEGAYILYSPQHVLRSNVYKILEAGKTYGLFPQLVEAFLMSAMRLLIEAITKAGLEPASDVHLDGGTPPPNCLIIPTKADQRNLVIFVLKTAPGRDFSPRTPFTPSGSRREMDALHRCLITATRSAKQNGLEPTFILVDQDYCRPYAHPRKLKLDAPYAHAPLDALLAVTEYVSPGPAFWPTYARQRSKERDVRDALGADEQEILCHYALNGCHFPSITGMPVLNVNPGQVAAIKASNQRTSPRHWFPILAPNRRYMDELTSIARSDAVPIYHSPTGDMEYLHFQAPDRDLHFTTPECDRNPAAPSFESNINSALSYWMWRLLDEPARPKASWNRQQLRIHCEVEGEVLQEAGPGEVSDDSSLSWEVERSPTVWTIRIHPGSWKTIMEVGNGLDRILAPLVTELVTSLWDIDEGEARTRLAELHEASHVTRAHFYDINANPAATPIGGKFGVDQGLVVEAQEVLGGRDNNGPRIQNAGRDELEKSLSLALAAFESKLAEFDSRSLAKDLVVWHERVTYARAHIHYREAFELPCFPGITALEQEVASMLAETQLPGAACKMTLERVTKAPPKSGRIATRLDIEELLAAASACLFVGHVMESVRTRHASKQIAWSPLLSSPFLSAEVNNDLTQLNQDFQAARIGTAHHDQDQYRWDKIPDHNAPELGHHERRLDTQLQAAWGYSIKDLASLMHYVYDAPSRSADGIVVRRLDEFKADLLKAGIPQPRIQALLDHFALREIEGWEPSMLTASEHKPWKHRRQLSYVQRALVVHAGEVIVGTRHLYETITHLIHSIRDGTVDATSPEMIALNSKRGNVRGANFEEQVREAFRAAGYEVRHVSDAECPVGDIDAVVLDGDRAFVIECKDIDQPRTAHGEAQVGRKLLKAAKQAERKAGWVAESFPIAQAIPWVIVGRPFLAKYARESPVAIACFQTIRHRIGAAIAELKRN